MFTYRRSQISFSDLWPSLRLTIMEEIRDECEGMHSSSYYPVAIALGLELDAVMKILYEDTKPWSEQDGLSDYVLELKRQYPNEPIDPDTPPPRELVKAVYFLRQQHLPASLLGEWQFPLPSIDAFNSSPAPCSDALVAQVTSTGAESSITPSTPPLPSHLVSLSVSAPAGEFPAEDIRARGQGSGLSYQPQLKSHKEA